MVERQLGAMTHVTRGVSTAWHVRTTNTPQQPNWQLQRLASANSSTQLPRTSKAYITDKAHIVNQCKKLLGRSLPLLLLCRHRFYGAIAASGSPAGTAIETRGFI